MRRPIPPAFAAHCALALVMALSAVAAEEGLQVDGQFRRDDIQRALLPAALQDLLEAGQRRRRVQVSIASHCDSRL